MNANKSLLGLAFVAMLGLSHTASAQEYDDRWYMTWGLGYNKQDTDRRTVDEKTVTASLGRYLNPAWSMDVELSWLDPAFDRKKYPGVPAFGMDWHQMGLSADFRRHLFVSPERNWNPYLLMGGGQRVEEEFYTIPGGYQRRKDTNLAAKLGVGVQTTTRNRNIAVRGSAGPGGL